MAENKPNPDANTNHINIIEGLMSKVVGHLDAISPTTLTQEDCKTDAIRATKDLQELELFKLRQGIENG